MASKLTLISISSGFKGTDIETNFTDIADEFDDTLSRSGKSPNQMEANIDMNSNRVMNLPAPVSSTEPLRKDDQFTSTEAQSFADDAETAKDAAETALSNFQSQYVGPSSSDPTTDGNGDALTEGDLYFDSTNDVLKIYDGSSWVEPTTKFFPNVDANVTATEDELNKLDGVTATTAEINNADEAATAGGGFMKGPTGAVDQSSLGENTWRTPSATRPTLITVTGVASPNGSLPSSLSIRIDESGGTAHDHEITFAYYDGSETGYENAGRASAIIPSGGSYQIRAVGSTTLGLILEWTL